MKYEPWEKVKQSIRDKVEELFRVCDERGVHTLHFEVDVDAELSCPNIEYKVGQYLFPKEDA